MKLKRNRVKQYFHKQAIPVKDKEGNVTVEYGNEVPFEAEMWAGGGKRQIEMYGTRLPNIRNLRVDGVYEETTEGRKTIYKVLNGPSFSVEDGICLYAGKESEPDYKIIAIYPYRFLTLEVEKR